MKRINYIFFSSTRFGRFFLSKIYKKLLPTLIITKKPKPQEREKILKLNPLAEFCLKKHLPFLEIENLSPQKIKSYQPEFGLIAGFGKILKNDFIEIFPKGILNIHPSLLPKLRGPSPIHFTILEGHKPGVSIFLIDELVDHGPIIAQKELKIKKELYFEELEIKLAQLGGELFLECIWNFLEGKIKPRPQNELLATYTRKLTFEDSQIKKEDSVIQAYRKVLAFHLEPGAWIKIKIQDKENILKITKASILKESLIKSWLKGKIKRLGTGILFLNNQTILSLNDGFLLLEEVQLEGKRKMSGKEFFNGYSQKQIELL